MHACCLEVSYIKKVGKWIILCLSANHYFIQNWTFFPPPQPKVVQKVTTGKLLVIHTIPPKPTWKHLHCCFKVRRHQKTIFMSTPEQRCQKLEILSLFCSSLSLPYSSRVLLSLLWIQLLISEVPFPQQGLMLSLDVFVEIHFFGWSFIL